eukprot:5568219-Pyramimonas_sp.AAC.1
MAAAPPPRAPGPPLGGEGRVGAALPSTPPPAQAPSRCEAPNKKALAWASWISRALPRKSRRSHTKNEHIN